MSNIHVTPGSLYIARFAQASAPHVGLIRVIPAALRAASFTLTATCHPFEHTNAAFSASRATCSPHRYPYQGHQHVSHQSNVVAGQNDFWECLPWVLAVGQKSHYMEPGVLDDAESLQHEFMRFAEGNKAHAKRDKFPKRRCVSVLSVSRVIVSLTSTHRFLVPKRLWECHPVSKQKAVS